MKQRKRSKDREERGFALLLVFAMAAAIAIMLYIELPRQAFERQRDKEQLLIDRGEQYQRAIKVYFRKFKQYPATLDALNETNGVHFVRHKYKDPMTGKDEWRLIHVGPGGVFTDSKTMAPPDPNKDKDKDKNPNTFITEGPAVGSTGQPQGTATPQYRRERGGMATPGVMNPGGQQYPGAPGTVQDPNAPQPGMVGVPGMPGGQQMGVGGQMVTNPTVPGQNPYGGPPMPQPYPTTPQPGGVYPVVNQYPPGQYPPGQYPQAQYPPGQYPQGQYPPGMYPQGQYPPQGVPGSTAPFQPVPYTYPPQPANSQQGGVSNPYYSTQPGTSGAPAGSTSPFQQPGSNANPTNPFGSTASNPATDMIKKLLMTPRPGGLNGLPDQGLSTITGGIAGIASKLEEDSIKVYNDHEEYDEWEFIYDPRKDTGQVGTTGITGAKAPTTGTSPTNSDPSSGRPGPANTRR